MAYGSFEELIGVRDNFFVDDNRFCRAFLATERSEQMLEVVNIAELCCSAFKSDSSYFAEREEIGNFLGGDAGKPRLNLGGGQPLTMDLPRGDCAIIGAVAASID